MLTSHEERAIDAYKLWRKSAWCLQVARKKHLKNNEVLRAMVKLPLHILKDYCKEVGRPDVNGDDEQWMVMMVVSYDNLRNWWVLLPDRWTD